MSERTKHFDLLVEKTDTALRHPSVVATLGTTANTLVRLNASLYLPNLVGDRIEVPPSKIRSDEVALFPLLETDSKIYIGRSFDELSESFEQKLIDALIASGVGGTRENALRIIKKAQLKHTSRWTPEDNEILGSVGGVNEEAKSIGPNANLAAAYFHNLHAIFDGVEFGYRGKDIIFTVPGEATGSVGYTGAALAHELVHLKNGYHLLKDPAELEEEVADELEAYHVAYTIRKAYWEGLSEEERQLDGLTDLIEQVRLRYANEGHPYAPTERVMKLNAKYKVVH
jgi:hypothetical protein